MNKVEAAPFRPGLSPGRFVLCAWAVSLGTCMNAVQAQSVADAYPSRPVAIIIPVTPGGGVDTEMRPYAQRLSENLGRPFVLDYKPGAGTTLGAAYVAKASPDGYTLLAATPGLVITPSFYANLTYDAEKDLAPVTLMTAKPQVMAVNPNLPIKTPAEYIAYTRANPGKLNVGTTGVGGSSHLSALWLDSVTGGKVTFVHYKGTGAMLTDLFAGRIDAVPMTIVLALSQAKAGKLRIIGNTGAQRLPLLPDLPSFAEQGAPGYDYISWVGVAVPAGTPAAIINKLRTELMKVGNAPDIHKRLTDDGAQVVISTPAEFGNLIKTEIVRWRRLVKENGIKPAEE
jgi:tripartite-type tricarboxylate transporter receptor subunit TctC